jgi:hypothetical protein
MLNMKQFSRLRFSGLHLLLGVLLLGVFSLSNTFATTSKDTVYVLGVQDTVAVKLENKVWQDSVMLPAFQIVVADSTTNTSDSVKIAFKNNYFRFAQGGTYTITQTGTLKIGKSGVDAKGDSLYIQLSGPPAAGWTTVDTITISGVYVEAMTSGNTAYSDSSQKTNLVFGIGRAATGFAGATPLAAGEKNTGQELMLLPGPIYNVAFTTYGDTTTYVKAGSPISAQVTFTDYWNNVPNDSTTTISVAAVLSSNGTSPGNGTLSGQTTLTHHVILGHQGIDTTQWTALKYTKAESIELVFTAPNGGTAAKTSAIVVYAGTGTATNISVALATGSSDTITVNQTNIHLNRNRPI